jgi:hypothetical protein
MGSKRQPSLAVPAAVSVGPESLSASRSRDVESRRAGSLPCWLTRLTDAEPRNGATQRTTPRNHAPTTHARLRLLTWLDFLQATNAHIMRRAPKTNPNPPPRTPDAVLPHNTSCPSLCTGVAFSCACPSPTYGPAVCNPIHCPSAAQIILACLLFYTSYPYMSTPRSLQPDARVFRIRATINLLALIHVRGTHPQNRHNSPVQPQNFGENKNQHHADEDARLAHERTHALLGLAMVLCCCFPSHIQRLLQCRWRSPQPDQTGQPTGRRPCAGSRHTASTSRGAA